MGGLAESNAGYAGFAGATPRAAGFSPGPAGVNLPTGAAGPDAVSDANRCPHSKYECNAVLGQLKSANEAIERLRLQHVEEGERLIQLEAVLSYGEAGGEYSLNMQRIKRMQEIDIIQRNDVYELEKTLADSNKALADYLGGAKESKTIAKLNQLEVILKQVPHGPMCKIDAGAVCGCHHKLIKAVLDQ